MEQNLIICILNNMKEEFSVPSEYQQKVDALYAQEEVTEQEFIELCQQALELVEENWENRQEIAYAIPSMLNFPAIKNNPVLSEIAVLFGELELPDAHVANTEEGVKEKWQQIKTLVTEASQKG